MRSLALPAKQSALLAAARGDAPADLLLRNAAIVNVFSGQIERGDIAVLQDTIVGIGPGYAAKEQVDLRGAFVTPGLIDAHVHIESSLCVPAQFAAAVVPHGVTCAVTDPHEIANVAGVAGLHFMARSALGLPLRVITMAPSCVPATHMESNGARLDADELADLLESDLVHGLAEVMNFPGVIRGDRGVWAKLDAFRQRPIDGHAPALSGRALNAYAVAGIGSEHECTTVTEAAEKLARGFYIFLREATNAHNLRTLLPLVNAANARRICLCTDDRMASDLIDEGSIDAMLRTAIASGLDPITALRMATLNPAEWFGLAHLGAVAPGRAADLLIVDDLADFRPRQVYVRGQLVAEGGRLRPAVKLPALSMQRSLGSSVHIDWSRVNLAIPAAGRRARVIGALEGQLITEERLLEVAVEHGQAVADPGRDILKMAVVERHRATGNVGLGFIQGLGLRRGAIAGTVAHDHHNLVVIGADDVSMLAAAQAVAGMNGGLAAADGTAVRAQLPLPVAGLMSDRPAEEVRRAYDELLAAAAALGSPLHDPFMAMSFMALEVIPKLKLTDRGLVDVEKFDFVGLFI